MACSSGLATFLNTQTVNFALINILILQPVNDLAPVFSMATYSTTIPESHAVNSPIGITVLATDSEVGHIITYFTVSSDTDSAFFHVHQMTGVMTLAHSLDVDAPDSDSSYSFRVRQQYNE